MTFIRRVSLAARLCALLAISVASLTARAASDAPAYEWRNVRVGGGGFSPAVIFSRVSPGLAYLRTDIGGIYRRDAREPRWVPLQDAMSESNLFGIESIAPDPVDADTVYVAAGMYRFQRAAVLRSTDRGDHWEIFPVSFRMGGNEDGRGLGERLAVDPNDPRVLYFGSRHDGLQVSRDRGRSWSAVKSFPVPGLGWKDGGPTHAGLSFVVIDPASGTSGAPSRTLFVGVADPAEVHLYRSDDAAEHWTAVAGQPRADLLPAQAQLDSRGMLYVAYANGPGPNGVTDGAVFRLDTHDGSWADITPDKSPHPPPGGYMGLSIDRQQSGTLLVATMNRWSTGDTLWRSTDDGANWKSLRESSRRDVSATPFLRWGAAEAEFGHWIAGVAIDPFDSSQAAYTTGATVYSTSQLRNLDGGKPIEWKPWTEGVEETAVITLTSPPQGPPLLSGFGDIAGFVHEDLDVSPPGMYGAPFFTNTVFLDYAALAPNIIVRGGRARMPRGGDGNDVTTLAWSEDSGRHWQGLKMPPLRYRTADGQTQERRFDLDGTTPIAVSADGSTFIASTPVPLLTRDRGRHWSPVGGLPGFVRVIADRNDAQRFYALDFPRGMVFVSQDGGASFTAQQTEGLPASVHDDEPKNPERPWPLLATPGQTGDLWVVGSDGLFHSTDGGRSFEQVRSNVAVSVLSFGKAPAGSGYPTLFAIGSRGSLQAIWRSDDAGRHWLRINDDEHEYGRRYRTLSGDPRIPGRVYVATDGRGIVYGDPR